MSRRSDEAQAVLLAAALESLEQGHLLRSVRLLWDCYRLGPMSPANQAEYDRLTRLTDGLIDAAA